MFVCSSGTVEGPSGVEALSVGQQLSSFCVDIGLICIPGRLLFSANFSYSIAYTVRFLVVSLYNTHSRVSVFFVAG